MKRLFRLSLLTIVLCTLFQLHSNAQAEANIIGPSSLCFGECATYEVVLEDSTDFIIISTWELNNGITLSGNPVTICMDNPNGISLFVSGFTEFQQDFQVETFIEAATSLDPRIISTNTNCPDSAAICDRICAFNSATYEVTNIPPGTPVTWQVLGAEDYVASGNAVTVEWGAPGQGEVSVVVGGSTPTSDPLQIFCGQATQTFNPDGIEDGYVQIIGGSGFYEITLVTPAGDVITMNGVEGFNTLSNLATGDYSVMVNSSDGQFAQCSITINPFVTTCWISGYPEIISMPSDCNACDGEIVLNPTGGGGSTVVQYSIDGGINYTFDPVFENLCPGTYLISVANLALGCVDTDTLILHCQDSIAGCSGEASLCVEILEDPTAQIASVPPAVNGVIEICQGQTVYFENESENAASYIWDFGNLTTSTQFEPSHTYQIPGTYNVSLIARNSCYCNDTTFIQVNVLAADVPEISCVGTVCEGESVAYTTDVVCSNYDWDIASNGTVLDGGGPTDNYVTVEWGQGPEGEVSLLVSGCAGSICNAPNIVPIPIISELAEIQGNTSVCEGSTEEYFIPDYQGTEIIWSVIGSGNIEDGQGTDRVTINWFGNANQGNPQKVIVEFNNCYLGCEGKDTLDVNIVPSFYMRGPIEVCENTKEEYSTFNTITDVLTSSNWQVIDAGGTVVWTSASGSSTAEVNWSFPAGTYIVRAEPTNPADFCNRDYSIFVDIIAAPVPVTSIDGETEICPGEPYAYQANGISTHTFNWEVIGGSPASFNGNPVNVTWNASPLYEISVTQTATTGLACTSDPVSLAINEIPSFSLTGNSIACMESTETYTAPFFENVDYQWTIVPADRGTVINGQGSETVEVQWNNPGPASVNLSVCGVSEAISVSVLNLPMPQVVHPAEICVGSTASVQTSVPYVSYQWFDDIGTLISTSPTVNLDGGYYELEVVDQNGCEGSTSFNIVERALPAITVSVPLYGGICPGGPSVTITASTTANGYDFAWFEGGTSVGTNSPFLTVNTAGSYSVVVTDQNGCTNTSNTLILTDCASAGGICVGGVCVFPGAGLPGSGCTPNGSISFQKQNTGDCLTHNYINTSINDVPGTWGWNFDDPASGANNTSSLENPSHTFSEVGFYAVLFTGQVSAVGGGTCPDGQVRQDTIIAVADFDFKTACPGVPVEFTDISEIMPFASITGYSWNFGDPGSGPANTSTDQHPTHTYQAPGSYTVTLTITEAGGCQASMIKNVTIFDPPNVSFALPALTCENTALPFSAVLSSDVTGVEWDFGDPSSGGANSSTSADTYHEFGAAGVYTVTLTATNIYGCTDVYTDDVTVTPNTLGGNIAYSQPSPICQGDNITLTAPAGGITYVWSTNNPTNQITVSTAGIYEVTLTDAEGCTYSPPEALVDIFGDPNGIIKGVEYDEFGQPTAFYENNMEVCDGEDVYLVIQGSLNYSYQWSGGNGTDEEISFTEDRGNLLTVGVHSFSVTVTDNTTGCTSEEGPFTVTVNPKPDVEIQSIPTGFLCENEPATLSVVSPDPSLTYSWNTGESGNTIFVIAGGTYFAQATNQFGCKNLSNEIVLNNAPDPDNIPAGCHSRCNPDTMCLPPMPNVATYQWFFNNTPIAPPTGNLAEPIFTQSGEYFVQMTDIYGCKSVSEVLTLDLFPGFGDVLGNVYYDVNGNGIIDGPDTLVSGIDIFINNGSVNLDTATSSGGGYAFPDILSANYEVILDTFSLPPGWTAYYINGNVDLVGCDVQEQFDWLVVNSCLPVTVSETLQGCPGDGVFYNSTFIPTGGMETFTFQSFAGCDSIVTVTVVPFPTSITQEQLNACTGSTVNYQGVNLSPGDQQDFVFPDVNGCDSTVQVIVGEWPTYDLPLTLMICENSSTVYNGVTLFPGDQQDFLFVSENGCDSIMSVTVEGFDADTTQQTLFACPGSTVDFQGVNLAPGDQQDFAFVDVSGCDSIVEVSVDAWPTYTEPLVLMACQNATVDFNGTPLAPGDQQDFVFPTINGCDSVIQVIVEAFPTDTVQQGLNACPGSTVNFQGTNLAPGDQQDFLLTGPDGCDSLVQVTVAAWPTYTLPITLMSCQNSFVDYNGVTFFPGDQQDVILTTVNGCDSIMQVTVEAFPTDMTQEQLNACPGSTVTYQGTNLSPGDQQDFTLIGSDGCDSIVQVSVSAWPTYTQPIALDACENSFVQYNGITLFPGDQQDVVLTTVNGCDSTMQVTVATIPVDTVAVPLQVCEGETIDYNGQQLTAGTQLFLSLTSLQTGCDSVVAVSVANYPQVTFDVVADEICWNGSDGEIVVQNVQGGSAPYLVSLDGNNYQPLLTFDNLIPGDYTVYVQDDNDCQYEESIEIPMTSPMVVETTDETMECGDILDLEPIVVSDLPVTYQWPDGDTALTYTISGPGSYPVIVTNACESVTEFFNINLIPAGLDGMIYMPNSFSPNDDGINDCYQGYVAPDLDIESFTLKIFDRWGNMMFETTDPNACWNGMHRDKQMQPAVFAWFMELRIFNCDGKMLDVFEEGDIHLIR